MRTLRLALLLCATLSFGPALPSQGAPGRADLVLVTLDTVRADRLGAYGDPKAATPALDGLAARGALFREAVTPSPLTLPAHASMLSGRLPHRHGVRGNGGFALGASVPLVAETLRDAGYATAAFVGAAVLDAERGLARGFDLYDDDVTDTDEAVPERPANVVVDAALAWWPTRDGHRFMWVHLFDAHRPYRSLPGIADPYRAEIRRVDRAVGRLLRAVGPDALVIVAGDHGEGLWDGGELEHGLLLTRSVTRVPLLVRPPGGLDGAEAPAARAPTPRPGAWSPVDGIGPKGLDLAPVLDAPRAARVVETPVSLVDVAPTLLDYAGLALADVDGRSLRPAVEGRSLPARPVYSETLYPAHHFGWSPAFLARDEHRQLVRDPAASVTDPRRDPWAERLLPDPATELEAFLEAHAVGWQQGPAPLDADTRARLEALGYVTAIVRPEPATPQRAADALPRLHRLQRAQGRMHSDPVGARRTLQALVAEDPGIVDAWIALAQLAVRAGDERDALAALDRVLARAPTHPEAAELKLRILRRTGRIDEALSLAERMEAAEPSSHRWIHHQVDLLGRAGREDAVLTTATRGLARSPDDPYLHYMSGLARIERREPAAALEHLAAARRHDSPASDLARWEARAVRMLVQTGRCGEATAWLRAAPDRGLRHPRLAEAARACHRDAGGTRPRSAAELRPDQPLYPPTRMVVPPKRVSVNPGKASRRVAG